MTAIEFLKAKGLISPDDDRMNVMGPAGPVNLVELLEEYKGACRCVKVKEEPKKGNKPAGKKL